jgi:predicted RND superfamily exporter protein
VLVFAADHDSETIHRLVAAVQGFDQAHRNAPARLVLGGGNLGVMAATNEAVALAEPRMLAAIFASLAVLCLLTFRDFTGLLVIIVPLALASLLCNATMAMLGIGLKVSTLPVVTLGVGVGVDYGIYLYERLKHHLHEGGQDGLPLPQAWALALHERGRAVLFTAATMSVGVGSWALSALKFQADMGLLLAFMFLVNVLGAMLLLPALACALHALRSRVGGHAASPAQAS